MDNTQKFTGLGEVYARSRPDYPSALLELLAARVQGHDRSQTLGGDLGAVPDRRLGRTASAHVVADIGAGTGKLTAELLAHGWRTIAVEPNDDMRSALVSLLGDDERLQVVKAPAEATGLPEGSVSLVTVAQAFHWFDVPAFRAECQRILEPGGQVALIWNFRRQGEQSVAAVADAFRDRVGGFVALNLGETITSAELVEFYGGTHYESLEFDNDELLDWETFRERHLSTSYAPKAGDPARDLLIGDLERIFTQYAVDGMYRFPQRAHVLIGPLAG